jgi:hypothetical protein
MQPPGLLVPIEVADELEAEGPVATRDDVLRKGASSAALALVVYNTASSTITLLQAPEAIRRLAESLVHRFRRASADERPFQLTARGPNGTIDFESDIPPDPEEIAHFLRRNVWGEDEEA